MIITCRVSGRVVSQVLANSLASSFLVVPLSNCLVDVIFFVLILLRLVVFKWLKAALGIFGRNWISFDT